MSDALLSVGFAGPHVSLQDGGRPGLMRYGVPRSGPMDRQAFALANIALGNPIDAPGIEISLGGLTLECRSGAVSFAVAGGGFAVHHADRVRTSWTVATLHAGETLAIRPGAWGSWCYLAFAGRLACDAWLGSASTHAMSGFGGGRLIAGQQLRVDDAVSREAREGEIPCPAQGALRDGIRITFGPQQRFFAGEALDAMARARWRITAAYDRMGVRLEGPPLAVVGALDMVSEPIVRGSIQVAGDGVATVLLADHQTTGGYPKIATILDCDLDAFVQLRPGHSTAFRAVDAQEAVALARAAARARHFHAGLAAIPGTLSERLAAARPIDDPVIGRAGAGSTPDRAAQ